MKGLQRRSLGILLAMVVGQAGAYEISTHALITEIAYQRSTLNPTTSQSIVPVLGFDRLDDKLPFRENDVFLSPIQTNAYFDDPTTAPPSLPPLTTAHRRITEGQDSNIIRGLQGRNLVPQSATELVSVDGWLMRGAIREDDNDGQLFGAWFTTDDRGEDPYGPLLRAGRHFYDPYLDREYTFINQCNTYGCVKSPLWSLGRTTPFNPPTDTEELNRRNHFTWQDARNNYWWALTSVRKSGAIATSFERTNSAYERKFRWGTTIDSIGHVIHLLQDAAQPQHTRNDAHAPPLAKYSPSAVDGEGEADAAFEAYTDNRVLGSYSGGLLGNPLAYMDGGVPDVSQLPALVYGSYPNVAFATPVEYFSTRHIDTTPEACGSGSPTVLQVCARRGLADYSNRGFFTAGTMPGMRECTNPGPGGGACSAYQSGPTYPMPEEASNPNDWESLQIQSGIYTNGKVVWLTEFARTVPDKIAPSHDSGLLSKYHGKVPLMTQGIFRNVLDLLPPEERVGVDQTLRYNNLRYDADVLVPRAIGYSAGMIDYFFRGRLEVLSPTDRAVAVLNQGGTHTMNADGYPCVGGSASDGCAIFGFEKVRVKVRNTTADITEGGGGPVVRQKTGGGGAQLVAIARYHRNTCYKPDLSGERAQSYAAPPGLVIAEPTCGAGQTTRTVNQEISVSAALTVAAGELDNLTTATAIEKLFDFTNDPIPVNATDLFIQVAYRGPMGETVNSVPYIEPDAIAVGTLDVREPTFVAFWNNTDYFWNGSAWLGHNGTYPNEGVKDFWACTGSPSKWVFYYQGAIFSPAMSDPVSSGNAPGVVRLGFVFPPPDFPTQMKSIRGVPVHYSAASGPIIPLRSTFTSGTFRQANKEQIAAATLAAPYPSSSTGGSCGSGLPSAAEYWCFDPIQKRRNQLLGVAAQPFYLEPIGSPNPTDVDAAALPAFTGIVPLTTGEIRFNTDTTLQACPSQPNTIIADLQHLQEIELLEEARELGVSGERE